MCSLCPSFFMQQKLGFCFLKTCESWKPSTWGVSRSSWKSQPLSQPHYEPWSPQICSNITIGQATTLQASSDLVCLEEVAPALQILHHQVGLLYLAVVVTPLRSISKVIQGRDGLTSFDKTTVLPRLTGDMDTLLLQCNGQLLASWTN